MTNHTLQGKRVAILATTGVEQEELTQPKQALEQAGAATVVVSPEDVTIKTWHEKEWGAEIAVDLPLAAAQAQEFDALLLPGGVMNPDALRQDRRAVEFVRGFMEAGKPVAAICHAPWLLVEAGIVKGRTLTSWPSLRTDITNAGGQWVDREVVTDNGLVTSRKPDDLPAFAAKMIEEFAEGVHQNKAGASRSTRRGTPRRGAVTP
jgi:protease I